MKKSLIAVAISTAAVFSVHANIVISETVEGSKGNNKAIEIANTSSQSIKLDGYSLALDPNGGNGWENHFALDGITLAAGDTYVVVHNQADPALIALANDATGTNVTFFNGNDALAIMKGGEIVDIVGATDGVNFNKNMVLRRVDYTPSTTYDAAKFVANIPDNDWSDLGKLSLGSINPSPEPILPQKVAISALQGNSWASPYTDPANGKFVSDESFTVEGIITAIQAQKLDEGESIGFFIQDETPDSDPNSSDGIFVAADVSGLTIGDKVSVTGKVEEKYGWTQIPADTIEVIGTGAVEAIELDILPTDPNFDFTLERHEGMLVRLTSRSDMRVSRNYSWNSDGDRYNMVLSQGRVNVHPHQQFFPNSDQALQAADCNDDARLVVESFEKDTTGELTWYPEFGTTDLDQDGSIEDYIRVGDQVDGLQGVIGYSYSDFRLYVTEEATNESFIRQDNQRELAPVLKEGDLRIATLKTNDYVNTPFTQEMNQSRIDSLMDIEAHTQKLVAALMGLDADIVALFDVENNGFEYGSAIYQLVNELNALLPERAHYEIAKVASIEERDAFWSNSYVIFRPAVAELESVQSLPMPRAYEELPWVYYNEEAQILTFSFKDQTQRLTLAVADFVDRDSKCEGKSLLKGEDSCAALRVSTADYLGQKLAEIDGDKIILGSLGAYAKEDAITVLTNREQVPENHQIMAAKETFVMDEIWHGPEGAIIETSYGYDNLLAMFDPTGFNSVQGDTNGSLDYILTSPGLRSKVLDATYWNINASESEIFDPWYEQGQVLTDQYRSAVDDPVVLSIAFNDPQPEPLEDSSNTSNSSSGGSTSLGGLIVLLGFGWLRRKFK